VELENKIWGSKTNLVISHRSCGQGEWGFFPVVVDGRKSHKGGEIRRAVSGKESVLGGGMALRARHQGKEKIYVREVGEKLTRGTGDAWDIRRVGN